MSELVQRRAKDIFSVEIEEDEKKLVMAAREGRITIIKGLLATNMVNINKLSNIDQDCEDEDTATPLFEAAKNGHTVIVRLLLDKGAQPDIPNDNGDCPLKAAAEMGHKEVVKLLIDSGADPNSVDVDKYTALHFAAIFGHYDVIQKLLDIGADPNISNRWGHTPLHNAVRIGHKNTAVLLLTNGAIPNPIQGYLIQYIYWL